MIRAALGTPTPDRLLKVAQALRLGVDHEQIYDSCKIDPWFIAQLKDDRRHGSARARARPAADAATVPRAQGHGLLRCAAGQAGRASEARGARRARRALDVHPVYKRIDTCAAEFASPTAYMYSTYEAGFAGAAAMRGAAERPRRRSSFSAAAPTASARASNSTIAAAMPPSRCRRPAIETIMVNCNPETVSTDYDTSDRLYFEPLTAEDVLEIVRAEERSGTLKGVIVQFGGQTPLKLAQALEDGERADPRHLARRHRPGGGPRPLQGADRAGSGSGSRETASPARRPRRAASPPRSASRS